jgi:hypothetical protein
MAMPESARNDATRDVASAGGLTDSELGIANRLVESPHDGWDFVPPTADSVVEASVARILAYRQERDAGKQAA